MSGHDEHGKEAALVAASAPPRRISGDPPRDPDLVGQLTIYDAFELLDEPELSNGEEVSSRG